MMRYFYSAIDTYVRFSRKMTRNFPIRIGLITTYHKRLCDKQLWAFFIQRDVHTLSALGIETDARAHTHSRTLTHSVTNKRH